MVYSGLIEAYKNYSKVSKNMNSQNMGPVNVVTNTPNNMNSVNVSSSKVPMAQQKQDVDNVVMGQTGNYKRIYNSSIYNDKDLIDASIIPSSETTISNIV
tara:strand:+ start:103 stop:402 length:300 start_codon:yes stop_codon:yes gene_type:complete